MIELAKRSQEEETTPSKRQRLDDWAEEISDDSLLQYAQNVDDENLWDEEISDTSLLQIDEQANGQTIHTLFDLSLKSTQQKGLVTLLRWKRSTSISNHI